MSEPECHCDGNGWIDCWVCFGAGWVMEAIDDLTEEEMPCEECQGQGGYACEAHDPGPDECK